MKKFLTAAGILLLACAAVLSACADKDSAAYSTSVPTEKTTKEMLSEKLSDFAETVSDKLEDASEKLSEAGETLSSKAEDASEKLSEKMEDLSGKIS